MPPKIGGGSKPKSGIPKGAVAKPPAMKMARPKPLKIRPVLPRAVRPTMPTGGMAAPSKTAVKVTPTLKGKKK
jgi:hypothetical protein